MKDVVVLAGLGPEASEEELRADAARRRQLDEAGVPYQVVYPPGPAPARAAAEWNWSCDKCSDPDCEHRLFTKLLHR